MLLAQHRFLGKEHPAGLNSHALLAAWRIAFSSHGVLVLRRRKSQSGRSDGEEKRLQFRRNTDERWLDRRPAPVSESGRERRANW